MANNIDSEALYFLADQFAQQAQDYRESHSTRVDTWTRGYETGRYSTFQDCAALLRQVLRGAEKRAADKAQDEATDEAYRGLYHGPVESEFTG